MIDFILFMSVFIFQRLCELWIARRNERWLRAEGAVEYGKKHYPFMIILHTLFIVSMIVEFCVRRSEGIDRSFAIVWLLLIALKIWVIASLGRYWNTKIFRIPGVVPIRRGPYKYFTHPNYIIVVGELIVVPFVFHLFATAVIFSILYALMLRIRIGVEMKALEDN